MAQLKKFNAKMAAREQARLVSNVQVALDNKDLAGVVRLRPGEPISADRRAALRVLQNRVSDLLAGGYIMPDAMIERLQNLQISL